MPNKIILITLGLLLLISLFFICWSYFDDPPKFLKALTVRGEIIFARLFISIYGIGKRIIIPALYIIFDPILIFIDDIIVGTVGVFSIYFYIKKQFFKSIRNAAPFPKPWRR